MTNPTIRRALSVIGSNGTASSTDCSPTAYITQNWRGKPLVSHKVIIQLIAATSTDKGLTVTCDIDRSRYPRGIKISKAQLAAINIERHSFHGEWNYTIKPNEKPR